MILKSCVKLSRPKQLAISEASRFATAPIVIIAIERQTQNPNFPGTASRLKKATVIQIALMTEANFTPIFVSMKPVIKLPAIEITEAIETIAIACG